jgi:hypothetical protein
MFRGFIFPEKILKGFLKELIQAQALSGSENFTRFQKPRIQRCIYVALMQRLGHLPHSHSTITIVDMLKSTKRDEKSVRYPLEFGNTGDLYHCIEGQTANLNRLSRRFWIIRKFRCIHLIHSGKIVHIS